jgi:hypothetical protein
MNLVGHFREDQSEDGEEMMKILLMLLLSTLVNQAKLFYKEPLVYENVKLVTRSYK